MTKKYKIVTLESHKLFLEGSGWDKTQGFYLRDFTQLSYGESYFNSEESALAALTEWKADPETDYNHDEFIILPIYM